MRFVNTEKQAANDKAKSARTLAPMSLHQFINRSGYYDVHWENTALSLRDRIIVRAHSHIPKNKILAQEISKLQIWYGKASASAHRLGKSNHPAAYRQITR
jgi:hypothetical protein